MFNTEHVNEFQAKLHETFQTVQRMFETLTNRAQAELKVFLGQAQVSSKEQVAELGKELVRLGERLQKMAHETSTSGSSGVQPPADPVN